mgnify:CR=1 FL=1
MAKKKTTAKKGKTEQKRGRRKGEKPEEVILFNRHNCMFYSTIKKGNKVVGRDYTKHDEKCSELQNKAIRAKDTNTTKLMKTVKNKEYKEDIFKALPVFFDYEMEIDTKFYPPGLFENTDNMVSIVPDKEKMLAKLDELVDETGDYLSSLGRPDLKTWLDTNYNKMITEDNPIGRTEKQNPDKVQLKQLGQLKLF